MNTMLLGNILTLFAVALIWGITNPFMKSGVQGLEKVKKSSLMKQLVAELWHLVKSWRYMLPFLINQGGSLLFYIAISKTDISLAVPIVNSLTLVVTLITGSFLGEKVNKSLVFGICMVMAGVSICIYEKSSSSTNHLDVK
eukprot:Seg506.3 transcript_id=Seg506.3/GoldUCD/mRNA.D3Y31 product="Transmembrane protein 234-like" protein_id=Seg506.3/GoldUCD/D3Y31